MPPKKTRLGELLLKKGLIDRDQLNSALAFQRQWGHRLGTAMVSLGFINEQELVDVLGETLNIRTVDLSKTSVDPAALEQIPYHLAVENDLIPIAVEQPGQGRKKVLTVAIADPLNVAAIDEIEFTYDCKIQTLLSPLSMISSAIRKYYLKEDTNIRPLAKNDEQKTGTKSEEEKKMTIIRGGQYEDIYDQEPAEPTSPEISADIVKRFKKLGVRVNDMEQFERLETYVYTLLRLLVSKGVITKDEFFKELNKSR
ncbi:MAG: hypothetical protein GXP49_00765 [Deltaproteobacteria bacterium]|nr:hypothetical protein [Deltaproteobacteria bacterium]